MNNKPSAIHRRPPSVVRGQLYVNLTHTRNYLAEIEDDNRRIERIVQVIGLLKWKNRMLTRHLKSALYPFSYKQQMREEREKRKKAIKRIERYWTESNKLLLEKVNSALEAIENNNHEPVRPI